MRGGWNQKEKRRRWTPKLFRTAWQASTWTLMVRQVKNSRRQSEAPGEEGEESESPKRKTIRVESGETQDDEREANDMDQESRRNQFRAERERAFRKSLCFVVTVSAAKRPASVVIKEGEESFATNLCQQCRNDPLEAKRRQTVVKVAVI